MAVEIGPLSINIRAKDGRRYKTISNLKWNDIPSFSIITGKNGSGKTQLLEVLAHHFTRMWPTGLHDMPIIVEVEGSDYTAGEIGYWPSGGRSTQGESANLAALSQKRQQAVQLALDGGQNDLYYASRSRRMSKRFAGQNPREIITDTEKLGKILTPDFEFLIDDLDVMAGLSYHFLAYRLMALEALDKKKAETAKDHQLFTETEIVEAYSLTPAPWDILNEALKVAGFRYEVISPEGQPLLDPYEVRLRDRTSRVPVNPLDLSSGEKVIFQLVLWLFAAGKEGVFPKLLILDEPDAHLHPSLTTQFLDVILEVLVNRHGVRVIMTSHSPSTVALAPEGSLFQLEREGMEVTRVNSRAEIIGVLTAGLITVSRASKYCLVEDTGDVDFYETIWGILSDQGPRKDPMSLRASPSINFIAASAGSGSTKTPGGKNAVISWVEKFNAEPMQQDFVGIIDRDLGNVAQPGVFPIGRYSIENYLLDPVVIFALLLEEGQAPTIPELKITSGDEHLLRNEPSTVLQAIVDAICQKFVAADSALAMEPRVAVAYTVGSGVRVPTWIINYQGHKLLASAQLALGRPNVINQVRLRKALQRCRLVPIELAALLARIQSV